MKCPTCKQDLLQQTVLEGDLPAQCCSRCEGIWISSNQYLAWQKTHSPSLAGRAAGELPRPAVDTHKVKLCPECGRILSRFRVVPNTEFYLDRCGHCNGVWLDKNEWNLLLARNLQDKLNLLFTEPWQARLREEEARSALDRLYLEKFGAQDYARIRDMWAWLKDHPQRTMILAFLSSDNPYKD